MKSVQKSSEDEARLRINTEITGGPARTVRELRRRGWVSSIREAIVLGLKSIEEEMLEQDLKRTQLRRIEEE